MTLLANLSLRSKIFLAVLVLVIIAIPVVLLGYTYQVQGTVTDVVTKKPVKDVSLTIGKHESKSDTNGGFSIKGIRLYEKENLVIGDVSGYEKKDPTRIEYKDRTITQDISVAPTLETTANYVNELRKNNQYDLAWEVLHPDDQAYWGSKETYVSLFSGANKAYQDLGGGSKIYKLGTTPQKLGTWKSNVTGKTYQNVIAIPVDISATALGIPISVNQLEHYQLVDGYYRFFSNTTREEVEQLAKPAS